ncbi:TfoX/Sxy family protein [Rasiella rasia]|uniref:TfoX/Sxy family protein n=1 Tax=Rasiella rasia TaxID=2744027 RepID=A0A6G6GIV0_9FLAO|nr:TfoX/Sxy family protein [Rasiella rasia]QIE58472.1 TfoX/Sxy family protein [Rasiella rasia]
MNRSDELIYRLQTASIPWSSHISEKKMFGGHCFLFKGKMCFGETKERLMVRVVADKMEATLAMPNVRPMDFTGKPIKEMVFVSAEGYNTEEKLQHFIELGIEHAQWKSTQ